MRRKLIARLSLSTLAVALIGCSDWQHNATVNGVVFKKVRIDKQGLAIGVLGDQTEINGRLCARGWVHVYTNGVPAAFTAAKSIELPRFTIPARSWVIQNPDGIVKICAFPSDTEIQGHTCRGNGGPTGVQTAFYPKGALKQYFLRHDTTIQGIPCEAGVLNQSIELHENGRLKACVLSESLTRDGVTHQKGKRIQLDSTGRTELIR